MLKHFKHNETKFILLASLLFLCFEVQSQKTTLVVSNSNERPGLEVNIKWISDNIIYDEGVNIYRREENVPVWTKINKEPLKKGDYQIPVKSFTDDSTLQAYTDLAEKASQSDVKDMLKVFFLLKAVYSNEFSRFLGIQFDDSNVVEGKTYRYMIKRMKGNTEIFEAVSELITVGPFIPEKSPEDFRIEAGDKKVNCWWKVDANRFHSVNIYRGLSDGPGMEKINPEPFILATRTGPDGRESYPEVYFTDNSVKNDTSYYYYITGIDFFGRETMPSDTLTARTSNRTPPPAAEYLDCKVNLLNIDLSWSLPENKKVKSISVYRSASIYAPFECITKQALSPLSVRYSDKVEKPGNYYYYVVTTDKNGNENKSNLTMAQVLDIYPPAAPANLLARADSGTITLSWNSVKDDYLAGYRIFRTVDASKEEFYVLLNAQPITDTFYVDKLPFNARNKFFYRVTALDTALNKSEYSNIASAVLPDVTPPDAPFIKNISIDSGAFTIEWLPNLEPDLRGFDLFREVTIDSVPIVTKINRSIIPPDKKSYIDIGLKREIQYTYFMQAIDSVGNRSQFSNPYSIVEETVKATAVPELNNIELKYISSKNTVQIKWNYAAGAQLKGAVVFRKLEGSDRFMPVSGLITGKEHTDILPGEGEVFVYRIFSYGNHGEQWYSNEYRIERSNNK